MDDLDEWLAADCDACTDGRCQECAGRTDWCKHLCGWLRPPAEETP